VLCPICPLFLWVEFTNHIYSSIWQKVWVNVMTIHQSMTLGRRFARSGVAPSPPFCKTEDTTSLGEAGMLRRMRRVLPSSCPGCRLGSPLPLGRSTLFNERRISPPGGGGRRWGHYEGTCSQQISATTAQKEELERECEGLRARTGAAAPPHWISAASRQLNGAPIGCVVGAGVGVGVAIFPPSGIQAGG